MTSLLLDSPVIVRLRQEAEAVAHKAYCPYSHFAVGAAVLAADGTVYTGCNVENASFGLTICAERSAIFQAVAGGQRQIRAVVLVTGSKTPTWPCGACRQVINEFGPDAEVFTFGPNQPGQRLNLKDLLPVAFGPGNLMPPDQEGPKKALATSGDATTLKA